MKGVLLLGILLRLEDVSQVGCGDGVKSKKLLAQVEEVKKFDAPKKLARFLIHKIAIVGENVCRVVTLGRKGVANNGTDRMFDSIAFK